MSKISRIAKKSGRSPIPLLLAALATDIDCTKIGPLESHLDDFFEFYTRKSTIKCFLREILGFETGRRPNYFDTREKMQPKSL